MADQNQPINEANGGPCSICGGTGFVRLKVPVGHPQFGKAVPCRCKEQERVEKRFERLRSVSNLDHLGKMTFDQFTINENAAPVVAFALGDAKKTAMRYAQDPKGWLLFTGPYGCGKTHLAAAIANARVAQGLAVLFVVVPDLLDYLRASYAPSSPVTYDERFDQIRNVELLVLDDLGTQNTTPWALEKLYQILNYRYHAELPTVITTNLALSDIDPRLASRLRDQSLVRTVPIYAQDHRIQGKDETFGSLSLYGAMTFQTFQGREAELESARAAHLRQVVHVVTRYAENPQNWLLLRGGYGVGKTHLAAAVANKVVSSGLRVMFVVASDFLDYLRATFQPGSSVTYDHRFNQVRLAWLLVLDDLGAQSATPWAQEKLFQILNHRYLGGLPTIITSSFQDWERLDERLQSRLGDPAVCTIVDIDLPSYRGASEGVKPRRTTRKRI